MYIMYIIYISEIYTDTEEKYVISYNYVQIKM